MKFAALETVVLVRDIRDHDLRQGDLGAVVEVHDGDGFEVEFVAASGKTLALLTLREEDVRAVEDTDLIAVRSLQRSA